MPRLRPRQPAAQAGRREVQHPLGAPRLPAAAARLELPGRRQRALVRHQEQEARRRISGRRLRHQNEITVISDGGTYDGSKGLPNLHAFTEKFATDHKLALPFVIDPQGKLAALVKADYALGQSVGIQHTPTIWVVTNQTKGTPFVEVVDRTKLYSMIDDAMAETKGSAPEHAAVHHTN